MPTQEESQLTLQGRATAAAGAAVVAAAIVNPLDVIKVGAACAAYARFDASYVGMAPVHPQSQLPR